jgi:hypothetical protein
VLFCLQHLETHTFRLHTLSDLARLWTCAQEANYPSHELSWTVQIQRIAYQPLPEVYTNHTVCYLAFFQLSYLNRVGSTQLYHFILLLVYPIDEKPAGVMFGYLLFRLYVNLRISIYTT